MSPLPPIVHLLALAVGLFGGWQLMDRVSPDLPSSEPGVVEAEEAQITGPADPESLLQPGPFSIAISQIGDQLGEDEEIALLTVAPAEIEVKTADSGEGVPIDDVSTSAPSLISYAIGAERKARFGRADFSGSGDLRSLEMRQGPDGPLWTALIDPRLRPPHAYETVILPGQVAFEIRAEPVAAP